MNYTVSYTSGPTGFGWDQEVNTIEEVKYLIECLRKEYTAMVTVYSEKHEDFIFYKECLHYKPEIDYIYTAYNDNKETDLRHKEKVRP